MGRGGSDSFTTASKGALGGFFHTYADGPNDYVVTVTVTDKDGASDSATFEVHVRNVAPTVELTGDDSADEGQTKTYTYTVGDPALTIRLSRSPAATRASTSIRRSR